MGLINGTEAWKKFLTRTYLYVWATIDPETLSQSLEVIFATETKETIIPSVAGIKKSHSFTDETKKFSIKSEKVIEIKYSFIEANYDAGKFLIITSGGCLKRSGLFLKGKTVFFKVDFDADVEIEEWY